MFIGHFCCTVVLHDCETSSLLRITPSVGFDAMRMRPGSPTPSGGKKRMAEDCKEESVATDNESDHTAAGGTNSLNKTVKLYLPLHVLILNCFYDRH